MSREALAEIAQQHTMDYVTKMGEDQKQELRDILSEGLSEGKGMRDIAKDMEDSVQSMKDTRARAIARTETTRAKNLGNWYKYKDKGFQSFTVDFTGEACDLCESLYENVVFPIDAVEMLPPESSHPNCMCVAIFHQETPEEYAEKYGFDVYDGSAGGEEETEPEPETIDPEQALEDPQIQDIIDKVKEYSETDLTDLLTTVVPEVTGSSEKLMIDDLTESMTQYLDNPKNFTSKWPARATLIVKLLQQIGL